MKDRQWRNLIKDVQNQRCILMLGPGLSTIEGIPLVEAFSKHLVAELEEESVAYEKTAVTNLPYIAQRFMTIPDIRRIDLEDEAISFYKEKTKEIPTVFKLLAQLPFHLIVNTTPENFIGQALKEAGRLQTHFLHYNYKKDRDEKIPAFSSEQTLVYNLFGSIHDSESLILTKKERVEFIQNVVRGNPPIPNKIVSEFDDRKTYLFLGFNIEDWRFPLLLESLQIEQLNSSFAPELEKYPVSKVTKSFFEDCYRFRFVENKSTEFVEELLNRFQNEKNEEEEEARPDKANRVVILYADKDEAYLAELVKHMSELEHSNYLEIWHQGKLEPGMDIRETTTSKLSEAETVLVLISADFIASEQFQEFEIPLVMQRKEEGLKVFPVMIRSTDLGDGIWSNLPILPSNQKPINNNFWNTPDEAYQQIVSELKNNLFS